MASVVQSNRLICVRHDDDGMGRGLPTAIPLLHKDALPPTFHLDEDNDPDVTPRLAWG